MKADKIIKFLACEGRVNVICADTTNLVQKARDIHDLSPLATAALGRLLTITALMAVDMKSSKNRLTIQMKGNGPIGTMLTVADNFPRVKGYVVNPLVDLPLNEDGKLDVGGAVGREGFLNVIKDVGMKEPYTGMVPITSGEIAEDFANYFITSEQKPTAVALGVLVDKDGVKSSGGYVIMPMPDATEEDIFNIERQIFSAGAISRMLEKNMKLEEIAKAITGDENIKIVEDNITPIFECDCSKEHFSEGLATLRKEDLEEIINEDGKAETVCHFCNKRYNFTKEELEDILNNIEK